MHQVKKNKEKILAIVFMITSITLLFAIMFLGKMLGREMSAQQALIKEQFPVQKKLLEPEDELAQLSPQQLEHLSYQERAFVLLFFVLFVVVIALFLLLKIYILPRKSTI